MPLIQPIVLASGGSNFVPQTRVLTINGVSFDLSADRTWTVEVLDNLIATAPLSYSSGTNTISITQSSASTDGYLSSADWLTFNNKVPYTGATGNVNLGEFGITAGYFGLDLTPTSTPTTQGTMFWSVDDETLDVVLDAAVTMKVGQDVFYYVKNQSGVTIPKGSVVRAAGTLGASGRILIEPFLADGTYPSKYVLGVTTESLANGADGFVTEFGKIRLIDTTAYADGTILYASPTTAGGFTSTPPVAPNNIVTIAIVIKGGAANGTIFVRPTFASNIKEDEGVLLTGLEDDDVLVYDSVAGLFQNQTKTTFLSGRVPTVRQLTINDVTYNLTEDREWSVGDFGTW